MRKKSNKLWLRSWTPGVIRKINYKRERREKREEKKERREEKKKERREETLNRPTEKDRPAYLS